MVFLVRIRLLLINPPRPTAWNSISRMVNINLFAGFYNHLFITARFYRWFEFHEVYFAFQINSTTSRRKRRQVEPPALVIKKIKYCNGSQTEGSLNDSYCFWTDEQIYLKYINCFSCRFFVHNDSTNFPQGKYLLRVVDASSRSACCVWVF